jgi:3-hydroxyacyl-CoA dehydrogenase
MAMLDLLLSWMEVLHLEDHSLEAGRVFLSGLGWRNPPRALRVQLRDEAEGGAFDRESRLRKANGLKTKLAVFPDATLWDAGDRVGFLELHGSRNCLGASSMQAIRASVSASEKSLDGLMIGSFARHFCLGADLAQVLLEIADHEWESVAGAIASLQNACHAIRYARIPVWAYVHSLCLGGGCELAMHCSEVAAVEGAVLGLPEAKIGLMPVGGGLKELAVRAMQTGSTSERLGRLRRYYRHVALGRLAYTPEVATAAGLLPDKARWLSAQSGFSRAKLSLLASRPGFLPESRAKIPWGLGQQALDTLMAERESLRADVSQSLAQWAATERIALAMSLEGRSGDGFVEEEHFLGLERKYALHGLQTKETLAGILSVLGLAGGK